MNTCLARGKVHGCRVPNRAARFLPRIRCCRIESSVSWVTSRGPRAGRGTSYGLEDTRRITMAILAIDWAMIDSVTSTLP